MGTSLHGHALAPQATEVTRSNSDGARNEATKAAKTNKPLALYTNNTSFAQNDDAESWRAL